MRGDWDDTAEFLFVVVFSPEADVVCWVSEVVFLVGKIVWVMAGCVSAGEVWTRSKFYPIFAETVPVLW